MNQLRGSYMKIVGEIGKSSCEHGREQKFRRAWYPLSHEHPLCLSKKPTGDGSQSTVRKPRTNYMNIVFANKMFASVRAASYFQEGNLWSSLAPLLEKTDFHDISCTFF